MCKNNCGTCASCVTAYTTPCDSKMISESCEDPNKELCSTITLTDCVRITSETSKCSDKGFLITKGESLTSVIDRIKEFFCGPVFTYNAYASDVLGADFALDRNVCSEVPCIETTQNLGYYQLSDSFALSPTSFQSDVADCNCSEYGLDLKIESVTSQYPGMYLTGLASSFTLPILNKTSECATVGNKIEYLEEVPSETSVLFKMKLDKLIFNEPVTLHYSDVPFEVVGDSVGGTDITLELINGTAYTHVVLQPGEEYEFKIAHAHLADAKDYSGTWCSTNSERWVYPFALTTPQGITLLADFIASGNFPNMEWPEVAIANQIHINGSVESCKTLCFKSQLITNELFQDSELTFDKFKDWELINTSECSQTLQDENDYSIETVLERLEPSIAAPGGLTKRYQALSTKGVIKDKFSIVYENKLDNDILFIYDDNLGENSPVMTTAKGSYSVELLYDWTYQKDANSQLESSTNATLNFTIGHFSGDSGTIPTAVLDFSKFFEAYDKNSRFSYNELSSVITSVYYNNGIEQTYLAIPLEVIPLNDNDTPGKIRVTPSDWPITSDYHVPALDFTVNVDLTKAFAKYTLQNYLTPPNIPTASGNYEDSNDQPFTVLNVDYKSQGGPDNSPYVEATGASSLSYSDAIAGKENYTSLSISMWINLDDMAIDDEFYGTFLKADGAMVITKLGVGNYVLTIVDTGTSVIFQAPAGWFMFTTTHDAYHNMLNLYINTSFADSVGVVPYLNDDDLYPVLYESVTGNYSTGIIKLYNYRTWGNYILTDSDIKFLYSNKTKSLG